MHEAQRAHDVGIGQFAIEVRDLLREQESFVNDRAAGERRNVEHLRVFDSGLANFVFGTFTHDVQLALEGIFVHPGSAAHENLLDVRLRRTGHAANRRGIDRRVAPTE